MLGGVLDGITQEGWSSNLEAASQMGSYYHWAVRASSAPYGHAISEQLTTVRGREAGGFPLVDTSRPRRISGNS